MYEIKVSTRRNKKYMVRVGDKWIHFGDKRYQQFKDQTPLKAFSHLDHGDETRRKKYYQRHKRTNDVKTALYWSNKMLW